MLWSSVCHPTYLGYPVHVREFAVEVSAVGELVHHQLNKMEHERSFVDRVLDINNTTEVLEVKRIHLQYRGSKEERYSHLGNTSGYNEV